MNSYYNKDGFTSYIIKLGKEDNSYYLMVFEDADKYETLINIVRYNKSYKSWQCLYCETLPYTDVRIHNQKWDAAEGKALVIYSQPQGSGGFISYEAIVEESGKIRKLASEEMIFSGTVFFEGDKLISGSGNQFHLWARGNDNVYLVPYKVPEYKGAYVIKYSIVDENTVITEQEGITVPVGGVIQLIREDFNPIIEKLMFEGKCLKYVQMAAFKTNCKEMVKVTIVPDAYNRESAKEISINVV